MTDRKQFNVRLPQHTERQVKALCDRLGMTTTQVIILAVDRLTRDLYPGDETHEGRSARTEAWMLAKSKDESGNVEQA